MDDVRLSTTIVTQIDEMVARTAELFDAIEYRTHPRLKQDCLNYSQTIDAWCEQEIDSVLFYLHAIQEPHIFHALYCATLVALLSRQRGIDAEKRHWLVAAAYTHDIGLHSLQKTLLQQSDQLQPDQRESVSRHPGWSEWLLKRIDVTEPIWLEAIQNHHERLSGDGYPEGLKSDQLSIGARLIGLVDSYTAMVRQRAHRSALTPREALRQLYQQRGTHFDAELVPLLIRTVSYYPPGTQVHGADGRKMVVICRGDKLDDPWLAPVDCIEYRGEKITGALEVC